MPGGWTGACWTGACWTGAIGPGACWTGACWTALGRALAGPALAGACWTGVGWVRGADQVRRSCRWSPAKPGRRRPPPAASGPSRHGAACLRDRRKIKSPLRACCSRTFAQPCTSGRKNAAALARHRHRRTGVKPGVEPTVLMPSAGAARGAADAAAGQENGTPRCV